MVILFIFYPLISWQIYFAPVFANDDIKAPVPKTTIVNPSTIKSLIEAGANSAFGKNYTNAQTWFPAFNPDHSKQITDRIKFYKLSIPNLNISNAEVSIIDNDLGIHLVNYAGTAVPPEKGTAVVFGHSTLPQLFNPKDYKTIFANAYRLKVDDKILVNVENVIYTYKIFNIIVVDPADTSVFIQNYDDSYLTLVTCTPPGTVWKRLIIKARLEKI